MGVLYCGFVGNCLNASCHMSLDVTKSVFRVSDKARLKPISSATETS